MGGLERDSSYPSLSVPRILKFFKACLSGPRIAWSVVGLARFLSCIEFNFQIMLGFRDRDLHVIRLLTAGQGFPLSRGLFAAYAKAVPTIIRFGEDIFLTEDFEDFYHASLYHERLTLDFALKSYPKGSTFVDIGANIGGYTVRFGKRGRVFAFEPHRRNYRLLAANAGLNDLKSAYLYNRVIGDRAGRTKLFLSEYHGRHSTIKEYGECIEVDCSALDLIPEIDGRVEILKVNVEGAECSVLQGALNTLKRTKFVIVETSQPHVNRFVREFLPRHGFRHVQRWEQNDVFVNSRLE